MAGHTGAEVLNSERSTSSNSSFTVGDICWRIEFLYFFSGLLNYIEYIFSTRGKGINVNLARKSRDEKDTGDEKEWER